MKISQTDGNPQNQSKGNILIPGSIGVGLRTTHYPYLEEKPPTAVQFFEAISENYMDSEGRPIEILEFMRRDYPIALHGVSLSIGAAEDVNLEYLKNLKRLIERINPILVSDHLCWTGVDHKNLHNLLPMPLTEESFKRVAIKLRKVQEFLGRRILIENATTYFSSKSSTMQEWEFLTELVKETDCRILLDVNNVYVNSVNHHFDPKIFIDFIPPEFVSQFHLAGYTDMGTFLFDTHSKPVYPQVWDLFKYVVKRIPHPPILIEWDEDIPEFSVVEQEAKKAKLIWEKHHEKSYDQSFSEFIPPVDLRS